MTGKPILRLPSVSIDGRKPDNRPPPCEQDGALASLAHEINNPLAALSNLLHQLVKETTLSEKARYYVGLARQEARRISKISHAAMNQFRDPSVLNNINVPALTQSVLDFYQSRLDSHRISIHTRYCPDGNLAVYPRQLRQMFTNLLLNAVDAMPGGGRIHVRISKTHESNGQHRPGLRLTLADNGCGIAMRDLSKICDPFFTTKGSAGNGLGLSLVKDTVEKHRGTFRVRSSTRPGQTGTIFTVFLPEAAPLKLRKLG